MYELIKWLNSDNIDVKIKKIENNERGVFTNKTIKKNKNIVNISLKNVIYDKLFKKSDWYNKLQKSNFFIKQCFEKKKKLEILIYILLSLDNKNFYFKNYIESLPKILDNIPINYDNSLLKHLKGSIFLEKIKFNKTSFKKDFNNLKKIIPKLNKISFKKYLFYVSLVNSRIFYVKKNNGYIYVLIPLIDMINHSNKPNTNWYYNKKNKSLSIISTCNINNNCEITNSYGIKSNNCYLINYGFIIENDEIDKNTKYEFNLEMEDIKINLDLDLDLKSENTKQLLRFLKKIVKKKATKNNIKLNVLECNKYAFILLNMICEKKLSKYNNSLSDNIKIMNKYSKSSNLRNIYYILVNEQKILNKYNKYALLNL